MRSHKKLPTIPNVAAGNEISITIPVGNVYDDIELYFKGVTAKQLQNITLELNGRMISEWKDGDRLISMDKHYSRPQTDGALLFNFNRPEMHVLAERRFFGLDTSRSQGITTAVIKIKIDKDAVAPELEAFAFVSQSVQGAPNFLTKVRRFFVPVSTVGTFEIDNIPKPDGYSVAAFHLYMPDTDDADGLAQITKAELLVDNVNWHDVDQVKAADAQKRHGRTPQTSESTVIDFVQDGDIRHALPLTKNIQDMRLRCEAASVGQVEVVVEYIGQYTAGSF